MAAAFFFVKIFLKKESEEPAKIETNEGEIISRCRTDFKEAAKQIGQKAVYANVSPYQQNYFVDEMEERWGNFTFLNFQYRACQLMTGEIKDKETAFLYTTPDLQDTLLKLFDSSNALYQIFKSGTCSSAKESIQIVKNLLMKPFRDVDDDKLCNLLKKGDTEEGIKKICLEDKDCFFFLKGGQENIIQIEHPIWQALAHYLDALRGKDGKRCPYENTSNFMGFELFPRISCEYYFSENNRNFCDKIYNEIENNYCSS